MKDVTVTITRETTALTQAGFGMPLLVATDGAVAYAECETLAEVVAAGFAAETDVHDMATAIFAQNPRPEKIAVVGVVGTVAQATAEIEAESGAKITVTAVADEALDGAAGNGVQVLVVDVGEALAVTYNASARRLTIDLGGATQTAAAIAAAAAAITELDVAVTTAGDFTVAADEGKSAVLSGGTGGVAAELDDLVETRNDWYFLLCMDRDAEDITELAAWAAANQKLYFACPAESVAGTIALAEALVSDRVVLIYHDDPSIYPEAAWVGRCAPTLPGSITWKFKTLSGIDAAVATTTNITDLHAANVNTYIEKYGVLQTSEGLVTSGEYIDVMRGQDWLEANIAEAISLLLFSSAKVPYDNSGIAQVVAALQKVLQQGTSQGIIATDDDGKGQWTVTAPDRDTISTVNRAARILPDVKFTAILAGAVHEVQVVGTLQV